LFVLVYFVDFPFVRVVYAEFLMMSTMLRECRVRRRGNKREDEDRDIMDISHVVSFIKGKNVLSCHFQLSLLEKNFVPI